MNIEIHKPELVQRLNAHIQNGHFTDAAALIEKALDALDEKASATPSAATAPRRHISEVISEIWSDLPDDARAKLPVDGAAQVDHYVYGLPKRNP